MPKKSKAYWETRQEQWWNNQAKEDDKTTTKLAKDYQRMAKETEKEIASYFQKYGKDDVIEYRTLMQSLSAEDKKMLYEDMETFAKKYPKHAHLMPIRESVYKLNRMQGLHYSMNMKLLELGAIEQEALEAHLIQTYGKNYATLMGEIGLGQTFAAINDQTILSTINSKWVNNENFSDRIWANKEKLIQYTQTEFRDAIARGDDYASIARVMSRRFEVGLYDARRLVATESAFVLNQSHTAAYINAGVTEYEISAVMDRKTSRICRDLDGEVFSFEDMEVGVNFPPFHAFCRTTFIGVMGDHAPRVKVQDEPESIIEQIEEAAEQNTGVSVSSASELKAKENVIEELRKENAELKKQSVVKEKVYTAKEIDSMSMKELRSAAEKASKDYYMSGKSGISFGDADIDEAVKSMVEQGSKTSLRKDIKSIQRKMKK